MNTTIKAIKRKTICKDPIICFIYILFKVITFPIKFIINSFINLPRNIKFFINVFTGKMNIVFNKEELKQKIRDLTPRQFEIFCEQIFKVNGYETYLTPPSADGGKDIIIKNKLTGIISYVECKHYSECNCVGRPIVQKLVGAAKIDKIDNGILMTTGIINNNAYKCAEKCGDIILYNFDDILNLLENTNQLEIPNIFSKTYNAS